MKMEPVNIEWEWASTLPGCGTLAVREQPYINIIEVSQRFYCESNERQLGISTDAIDQVAVKDALYEEMCSELPSYCPELWPDYDDLELRWRPGSDRLSAWIDAILMPKD